MKKASIKLCMIMLLTFSLEAMGDDNNPNSVRTLMKDCGSEQAVNRYYCLGYVAGILHGFGIKIVDESNEAIREPFFVHPSVSPQTKPAKSLSIGLSRIRSSGMRIRG